MLDVGWSEIFFIVALAVILVGPDEIPGLMVNLGRIVRRITYIKYAFSRQFDEFMEEVDLKNIRNSVNFEVPRGGFNESASDEDAMATVIEPQKSIDKKSDDPDASS